MHKEVHHHSDHGHTDHAMQECIDACQACHSACLSLVPHCLEQGGEHAEAAHIRLLLDCAQSCATSVDFMLRGSAFHSRTCGVCAEICTACAEDCERFPNDEMMAACAKACRHCAELCRQMAAA